MKKIYSSDRATVYTDTYGNLVARVDRSPDGTRWLPTLSGEPLGLGTYRSRVKAEKLASKELEALERAQTAEANAQALQAIKQVIAQTIVQEDLVQLHGITLTESEQARVRMAKSLREIIITNGAG